MKEEKNLRIAEYEVGLVVKSVDKINFFSISAVSELAKKIREKLGNFDDFELRNIFGKDNQTDFEEGDLIIGNHSLDIYFLLDREKVGIELNDVLKHQLNEN